MKKSYDVRKILSLLRTVYGLLEAGRKRNLIALLFLMIVSGVLEMASLGMVVPFFGVLLNPEAIRDYALIGPLVNWIGVADTNELAFVVTCSFLFLVLISAVLRGVVLLLSIRVSHIIGARFETNVFKATLMQSYEEHVRDNSSHVLSKIMRAGGLTSLVLSTLTIVYGCTVAILITTTVIMIDPFVSITVFLVIAVVYILIIFFTTNFLQRNGKRIKVYTDKKMQLSQEGLGGIRNIILEGRQLQYARYFEEIIFPLKKTAAWNRVVGQMPRVVIEPVGVILISIIGYWLAIQGGLEAKLPVLAAFAFAAQRLLPTMQMVYSSWAQINSAVTRVEDVVETLVNSVSTRMFRSEIEPLAFETKLQFEDVSFSYGGSSAQTLTNVNVTIEQGQKVGFVGKTGSGKSTTLDLILGLLRPSLGRITVDGGTLSDENTIQRWQRAIAHVPQDIHFADATIAENIAFGVDKSDIDLHKVLEAIEKAELSEFVATLPEGLYTAIGEGGKQLSGGQRQRIGIARALYLDAKVLVLDEATSALDNQTERAVLDAITNAGDGVTLVIVTHRIETLDQCDVVHVLEEGKIVRSGTPQDVIEDYSS